MKDLELRNAIDIIPPEIQFNDYERLKEEATEIAFYVSQIEVTEDNTKEAKKLLAKVNKSVEKLNRKRIDIKNELMRPYDTFASQVREIEKIVKDADEVVRSQVRQLEEREREEKRQGLEQIWNARIDMYAFAKVVKFDDWLEARHLNKTQPVSKSETEMVNFLERVEEEIGILANMENSSDLINEYKKSLNIATAMNSVSEKQREIEKQKEILKEVVEEQFAFIIKNKKDKTLLELLLKENNITYELRRI